MLLLSMTAAQAVQLIMDSRTNRHLGLRITILLLTVDVICIMTVLDGSQDRHPAVHLIRITTTINVTHLLCKLGAPVLAMTPAMTCNQTFEHPIDLKVVQRRNHPEYLVIKI